MPGVDETLAGLVLLPNQHKEVWDSYRKKYGLMKQEGAVQPKSEKNKGADIPFDDAAIERIRNTEKPSDFLRLYNELGGSCTRIVFNSTGKVAYYYDHGPDASDNKVAAEPGKKPEQNAEESDEEVEQNAEESDEEVAAEPGKQPEQNAEQNAQSPGVRTVNPNSESVEESPEAATDMQRKSVMAGNLVPPRKGSRPPQNVRVKRRKISTLNAMKQLGKLGN